MKIAIMGSGGLGGFYGTKLKLAGYNVTFIARGQHLKAIKENGLNLIGPENNELINNINATDNPFDIGFVDVVLFCVKLYDVEIASKLISPIVNDNTIIISVLNGINGPDRIDKTLQKGKVFGGASRVSAKIEQPGVIKHLGLAEKDVLIFGNKKFNSSEIALEFCDACNNSGFNTRITEDIEEMLWDKMSQLCNVAALTTLGRIPIGKAMQYSELFEIGKSVLQEVEAVAKAKKIKINPNLVKDKIALIKNFPNNLYASMYHDLIAGKNIEAEDIFGYLSNEGKNLGVSTPVTNFIYAFLKPHIS